MNPEAVFVRRYSYPASTHNWPAAVRPLDESQGSTGGNRPTWEMVNAFPMRDGRPSAGHPLYDSLTFWKNRDPRFYATIATCSEPSSTLTSRTCTTIRFAPSTAWMPTVIC